MTLFSADLLAATISLDFRVTVLEENGGGDGNSSVAELEVRVETLEGAAADHETRILAAQTEINGRCKILFLEVCEKMITNGDMLHVA